MMSKNLELRFFLIFSASIYISPIKLPLAVFYLYILSSQPSNCTNVSFFTPKKIKMSIYLSAFNLDLANLQHRLSTLTNRLDNSCIITTRLPKYRGHNQLIYTMPVNVMLDRSHDISGWNN